MRYGNMEIKQFSYEICQKHKAIIRYMETDKDHIHYMIETESTMFISKMVNLMKSYTTYHIWERYPNYLRKHFWIEHLAVTVLFITRRWHTEKNYTRKKRKQLEKLPVIIIVTKN